MDDTRSLPAIRHCALVELQEPAAIATDPVAAAMITRSAVHTAAWQELVTPILMEIDTVRDRENRRGPKTLFTSLELEMVFLFAWIIGAPTVKDARVILATSSEARKALGFSHERGAKREGSRVSTGLPSEPSLSRHRQRVGDERRRSIYETLHRRHAIV